MVSLYTIAKARSGSAVVIGRLIPGFGVPELVLLMAASLIAAGVSALVIMRVARWSVKSLAGLDYRKASLSVIAFLVILVAILTGVPGLLLLGVSSMVGILAPLSGARRSNAMGALIIPLIVFYAGF